MQRLGLKLLACAAGCVALAGCGGGGAIECESSANCGLEAGGECLPAPGGGMFCAYPDATCAGTGMRWSDLDLPDAIAGECVAAPDGGTADGGTDAAPGVDADQSDGGGSGITVVTGRLAAGLAHTCALVGTSVRCWGEGDDGRLGYAAVLDIGDNETPVSKGDVAVGGAVAEIAAGGSHTCARLTGGTVRCWGRGTTGRLGYGNTETIGDGEEPSVAGDVSVGGTVVQVVTGGSHTCALIDGGTVRCWGFGANGALGYGSTANVGDDELPSSRPAVAVGGTVTQLAAGENHTCALLDTGAVRCWGFASQGQLGYGNTTTIGDTENPSAAGDVNVGGTATQIAAGGNHTCALLDTGAIRCWGFNGSGELGYGHTMSIGDTETPASQPVVDIGGTAVFVGAAGSHSCALLDDGRVRCWGEGDYGRLGYANQLDIGDNEAPYTAGNVGVGATAVGLALGSLHTCVLLEDDNVRCWGYGGSGRLGYGNVNNIGDSEAPTAAGNVPYK